MFPGQGAQRVGMLHALPDHPQVRATLQQAALVLTIDPLSLDSADALHSTVAVQLCLLIAGVAMARVLASHQAHPAMVAGLSIGAFPAAVVAGVLDFSDAVRLVQRRGQLMETAYPHGFGLAAISGLEQHQLEPLIARCHGGQTHSVYLANLNAPRQFVIAGSDASMQAVMELARIAGASNTVRLAVNVPSHCALLESAAQILQSEMSAICLQRPQYPYFSSSAARSLSDPARIKQDLAHNMACQVHWSETARLIWECGARLAVEMPGGSVLSHLVQSQWPEGQVITSDTTRLDNLVALIARASMQ